MTTPKRIQKLPVVLGLSLLSSISLLTTSCDTAGQGALLGGALGAGTGAVIGNQSGNAGEGAVIGGVAGAAGGALLSNEKARRERQQQYRY